MNIQYFKAKIKDWFTPELYTALVVVLVGLGSFGLGRLSIIYERRAPVRFESFLDDAGASSVSEEATSVSAAVLNTSSVLDDEPSKAASGQQPAKGGQLVGSKNGNKYHFPWCSGAARIAEANKVWFNSGEEAKAAGYSAAKNCPGLE